MDIFKQASDSYIQAISTQGTKTIKEVNDSVTSGTNSLEVFKDLKLKEIAGAFTGYIAPLKKEISESAEKDCEKQLKKMSETSSSEQSLLLKTAKEKVDLINILYNSIMKDIKSTGINSKLDKASIVNNLVTGGADKVLSAEQGKYLENNKVDSNNYILNNFNGTFADFKRIAKSGTYTMTPNVAKTLGISAYGYGGIDISFARIDQNPSSQCNMLYFPDGGSSPQIFSMFNFTNNPTGVFSPDMWQTLFTTGNSHIQQSPNGYQKLPSGLIIQWGTVQLPKNSTNAGILFSLPVAFTSVGRLVANAIGHMPNTGMPIIQGWLESNNSTGRIQSGGGMWGATGTWIDRPFTCAWIAIGY